MIDAATGRLAACDALEDYAPASVPSDLDAMLE
jgi:hypothetical protein